MKQSFLQMEPVPSAAQSESCAQVIEHSFLRSLHTSPPSPISLLPWSTQLVPSAHSLGWVQSSPTAPLAQETVNDNARAMSEVRIMGARYLSPRYDVFLANPAEPVLPDFHSQAQMMLALPRLDRDRVE